MASSFNSAFSVDALRLVVSKWTHCWDYDEVKKCDVLFLPIPAIDAREARDWVLAVVRPIGGEGSLGQACHLQVTVYDRMVRAPLSSHIRRFVQALFGDEVGLIAPEILQEDLPRCLVATQRLGCVLGLIATFVQQEADIVPLDRFSPTFVLDMFAVFRGVFAKLRRESAARSLDDIRDYVEGDVSRQVLSMFGEVLRPRPVVQPA